MSSRREKKSLALAALRQRRQQGASLLDDYELKEEEDVYDVVDDDEYQNMVDARRQREDFIVDDDGLGYYDDGEEHLGGEEDHDSNKNKKRPSGGSSLTAAALKKARRNKAVLEKHQASKGGAADGEPGETKSRSMWEFVQRGVSVSTDNKASFGASSSGGKGGKFGSSSGSNNNNKSSSAKNVDALLEQLDEAPLVSKSSSRRRTSSMPRRRGVSGHAAGRNRRPVHPPVQARRRRVSDENAPNRNNRAAPDDHYDDDDDAGFTAFGDDGGDDDYEQTQDVKMQTDDHPSKKDVTDDKSADTPGRVRFAEDAELPEATGSMEQDTAATSSAPTSKGEGEESDKDEEDDGEDDEEEAPRPKRRLLARPRLGQKISAPARMAVEEQQVKIKQESSAAKDAPKKPAIPSAAMTSSFKPDAMAAESSAGSSVTTSMSSSSASLEKFVSTSPTDPDEQYLDFFWMDIAERANGEILLFGKVAVPPEQAGGKTQSSSKPEFVSCCALVKHNVRNLFVLPRKNQDGEYESMQDVHMEVNKLIKGSVMPRSEGATWRGKVVKRKYAFEDGSIPREETDYLKVVYDAKFPSPSEDVCDNGGKHFQRILGAGASLLETFIIKRKLMGPCWLRIKNPDPTAAPVSWCKLELQVLDPKSIIRLDQVEGESGNRPPPPVVAVSIKMKTVVNPKTHKAEIVAVSAVCHKQVLLDTASDESSRNMTHITIIRPLATSDEQQKVQAKFPRDFEREASATMPELCREFNERALLSRLLAQLGQWDPDVLVGHNAWGFDAEVLLNRCKDLKVTTWSKIGRRRRMQFPPKNSFSGRKDYAIADALSGRLLCDTYLSAKELLRETTYSLTNLAATQLKTMRQEIEPVDVPLWFESSKTIVKLALHTLLDAQLVHRLMFKLQILPLTKQLTCIAGNLWSHTMKSNRAERTEYLLLHEFHRLKHLVPEKRRFGSKKKANEGRAKAKYSGGLVLEPKKGLYDSFILLLDFNSLYPSLIQEYNLCFTTIDWAAFAAGSADADTEHAEDEDLASKNLPPLPDESCEQGVLPKVIKSLVDRRRNVKKMLKSEQNSDRAKEVSLFERRKYLFDSVLFFVSRRFSFCATVACSLISVSKLLSSLPTPCTVASVFRIPVSSLNRLRPWSPPWEERLFSEPSLSPRIRSAWMSSMEIPTVS